VLPPLDFESSASASFATPATKSSKVLNSHATYTTETVFANKKKIKLSGIFKVVVSSGV
jgi:hypothetical protein